MFIAYLIVTVVTAAANVFSATLDFIRYKQISINMARVGVPESWMPLLGILKGAAAVGLQVGIGVPFVGASAALGLVCFFVGALVTHLRARDYSFGLAVVFLALAVATLVLTLHARAPVAFAGVHTRIPHTHRDDSPRTHHRATTAGRPDGGHVIDLKDHPCVGVRGVSSQLIQASSQVIPAITEYSQRSAAL